MTLQQLRYVIEVAKTGSMNVAAKQLFVSQPSLSMAIRELENDVHISIFERTTKGVVITAEGEEFLGYARQIINQVELLEDKYIEAGQIKKKFGVSAQHYSFAVKAFVEMVKGFDMDKYEFAIREARTYDVIHDVVTGKSEIGILYTNEFNEKVLKKIFKDNQLEFVHLFTCEGYAYLWKNHPLAGKKVIALEELQDYPCLSFEQGDNNSFYFAEEILSTYDFKKTIKSNDRATNLNLMIGLNAFTLCSGIICEELNGSDYIAVKLAEEVTMDIGYIKRTHMNMSEIGELYIEEIKKYVGGEIKNE
ncbi:MAG: LysR family transcriptional regulator [Catonella sp.]|uniref:LysR family transcriptional regulator n=1 Tax=Catonella sp. TaxID=2382125 RepID=UPI003F9EE47E